MFFIVYHLSHNIATAFLAGRLISGVCNYLINHKYAFRSDSAHKKTFWRYVLLAACLYIAVYSTIMILNHITANIYLAKFIAEPLWFIVSYIAQHYWLFKKKV